jgi:hypothetical protein
LETSAAVLEWGRWPLLLRHWKREWFSQSRVGGGADTGWDGFQVKGRLLVALAGGSPLKPSEVALLDVESVDALIASTPEQWQILRKSSTVEVWMGVAT